MKAKFFILASLVLIFAGCKQKANTEPQDLGEVTIDGVFVSAANPCLTEPCLPGVEVAFSADKLYYLRNINIEEYDITVEGGDYVFVFLLDEQEITSKDSIRLTGELFRRFDIRQDEYYSLIVSRYTRL